MASLELRLPFNVKGLQIIENTNPHKRPGIDRHLNYTRVGKPLDIQAQIFITHIQPWLGNRGRRGH
jgi:hypothetical protein